MTCADGIYGSYIVREHYGRRVRKIDPEYGIKRLLLRNIEDLTDDQFDKLSTTLADHPHLTDLAWTWIAKEDLRDLLALRAIRSGTTPTEAEVQQRWNALHAWRETHNHIPELVTLCQTLAKWRQEIFNAVLTSASNAGSEGVNRIQKLDMRASFGYRSPINQRRRARVATLQTALTQRHQQSDADGNRAVPHSRLTAEPHFRVRFPGATRRIGPVAVVNFGSTSGCCRRCRSTTRPGYCWRCRRR